MKTVIRNVSLNELHGSRSFCRSTFRLLHRLLQTRGHFLHTDNQHQSEEHEYYMDVKWKWK